MDMIIKLKGCCEREEKNISSSLGLKPSEYRTLALIKEGCDYTNDQLSEETGLSKSRGSRVFENLVKKGFLLRRENAMDKRSFLYELTNDGKRVKMEIAVLKKVCENKILLSIKDQDHDIIHQGLYLLLHVMEGKSK
ncbi:MAG: MarR family transcriptional regulator [Spirochaetales bacterium]|nr:MarR family transcriptional regulator [Spirochaetales bacterium]